MGRLDAHSQPDAPDPVLSPETPHSRVLRRERR